MCECVSVYAWEKQFYLEGLDDWGGRATEFIEEESDGGTQMVPIGGGNCTGSLSDGKGLPLTGLKEDALHNIAQFIV